MFDPLPEPGSSPNAKKWLGRIALAVAALELFDRYFSGKFHWMLGAAMAGIALSLWFTSVFMRRW